MRYLDVTLAEEPPALTVERRAGETHFQAAVRALAEAQATGPMRIVVSYPGRMGWGRTGPMGTHQITYYADGGRVLTTAAHAGTCSGCGGWTPNLLCHPWAYALESGRGWLYCPRCYRAVLGIPPEVALPTKIVFPEGGPPQCTCGGEVAIPRFRIWDDGRVEAGPALRCARCGTWARFVGRDLGRRLAAARDYVDRIARPICFWQRLEPCQRLGLYCPWGKECRRGAGHDG